MIACPLKTVGKGWIVERVHARGLGRGGRGFERHGAQRGVKLPSRRKHALERRAQGRRLRPRRRFGCGGALLLACGLQTRLLRLSPSVVGAENYSERSDAR
jgi:hypothetical protein